MVLEVLSTQECIFLFHDVQLHLDLVLHEGLDVDFVALVGLGVHDVLVVEQHVVEFVQAFLLLLFLLNDFALGQGGVELAKLL